MCNEENQVETSGPQKYFGSGGVKVVNALTAIDNDVTALVLADCNDEISSVQYVLADASNPLPFQNSTFDIFTSAASLHLLGLGRYGDKLDSMALLKFIAELERVMKVQSDLYFSISYGPNALAFNEGYKFDLETIQTLFKSWSLEDWLIDNKSGPKQPSSGSRYTKDLSLTDYAPGEYRVMFMHYSRAAAENSEIERCLHFPQS